MDRKSVLILITLLSSLALSACGGSSGGGGGTPASQPTNLDPSFGTNGKVTTEFISGSPAEGYAMAIQGDGKIVMAGYAHNGADYDFALARYNIDGSLDTSFGSGTGKVMTNFSSSSDDRINAVVIDGSGRIVVAGYARGSERKNFALARYNTNGSLDTSFGSAGTGKVTTPFYSSLLNDQINAIALQTDGKIVVAGYASNGTSYDFALARYNTDGTLDTSFNNLDPFCFTGFICNGKQRTDFNSDFDAVYAVVIQTDGKIVVAGYAGGIIGGVDGEFALARYNTNGSLDTSFGSAGTGKVTTPFYSGSRWSDIAYAMILQTDGKIVAAGRVDNGTNFDFALARYNTNGTLDASFNYKDFTSCVRGNPCSGQVVTDFDGAFDSARAITIEPIDNKIVVVGSASIGSDTDFALVRYNADGTLDTSFGPAGTGKVTTDFGDADYANSVALQTDGKIVATGFTGNGANSNFALARYLP